LPQNYADRNIWEEEYNEKEMDEEVDKKYKRKKRVKG
jgi:hypothetical protein